MISVVNFSGHSEAGNYWWVNDERLLVREDVDRAWKRTACAWSLNPMNRLVASEVRIPQVELGLADTGNGFRVHAQDLGIVCCGIIRLPVW